MKIQTVNANDFIIKINKMQIMLDEIRQEAFLFDKNFQESIKKGEEDIKNGMVTVCKTEEELDNFFDSI